MNIGGNDDEERLDVSDTVQKGDVEIVSISPEDAEVQSDRKVGEDSLVVACRSTEQSRVSLAAKRSSRRKMAIDARQQCLECENDCELVHSIEDFRKIDSAEYGDVYYCDECNSGSPSWPAWHCPGCGSDWCTPCAMNNTQKRKRKAKSRKKVTLDQQ